MKVIGAGWGRTGTNSLKSALNLLGFNCYSGLHSLVPEYKEHHMKFFIEAVDLKLNNQESKIDFISFFNTYGFNAGVDMNVAFFYKELINVYPNVKVILTKREFESWYKSFYSVLYLNDIERYKKYGLTKEIILFNKLYYDTTFEGKFENKEFIKNKYNTHIEEVIKFVPKEKLLIFDVKEGWNSLCQFLDKKIPSERFPHENDSKQMIEFIKLHQ